ERRDQLHPDFAQCDLVESHVTCAIILRKAKNLSFLRPSILRPKLQEILSPEPGGSHGHGGSRLSTVPPILELLPDLRLHAHRRLWARMPRRGNLVRAANRHRLAASTARSGQMAPPRRTPDHSPAHTSRVEMPFCDQSISRQSPLQRTAEGPVHIGG